MKIRRLTSLIALAGFLCACFCWFDTCSPAGVKLSKKETAEKMRLYRERTKDEQVPAGSAAARAARQAAEQQLEDEGLGGVAPMFEKAEEEQGARASRPPVVVQKAGVIGGQQGKQPKPQRRPSVRPQPPAPGVAAPEAEIISDEQIKKINRSVLAIIDMAEDEREAQVTRNRTTLLAGHDSWRNYFDQALIVARALEREIREAAAQLQQRQQQEKEKREKEARAAAAAAVQPIVPVVRQPSSSVSEPPVADIGGSGELQPLLGKEKEEQAEEEKQPVDKKEITRLAAVAKRRLDDLEEAIKAAKHALGYEVQKLTLQESTDALAKLATALTLTPLETAEKAANEADAASGKTTQIERFKNLNKNLTEVTAKLENAKMVAAAKEKKAAEKKEAEEKATQERETNVAKEKTKKLADAAAAAKVATAQTILDQLEKQVDALTIAVRGQKETFAFGFGKKRIDPDLAEARRLLDGLQVNNVSVQGGHLALAETAVADSKDTTQVAKLKELQATIATLKTELADKEKALGEAMGAAGAAFGAPRAQEAPAPAPAVVAAAAPKQPSVSTGMRLRPPKPEAKAEELAKDLEKEVDAIINKNIIPLVTAIQRKDDQPKDLIALAASKAAFDKAVAQAIKDDVPADTPRLVTQKEAFNKKYSALKKQLEEKAIDDVRPDLDSINAILAMISTLDDQQQQTTYLGKLRAKVPTQTAYINAAWIVANGLATAIKQGAAEAAAEEKKEAAR
ncbi:MAG: hypothetical protein WCW33_05980 [Candidatus Babeliales bacterium]|jgi:hypothetical protein